MEEKVDRLKACLLIISRREASAILARAGSRSTSARMSKTMVPHLLL
jgi:hypothetical protein